MRPQVLDLSAHTRLTSLVFRARLPGSAAATSLRHHHQHHPLHPLRAPQPSPLPCPAPLRGSLQQLPYSLLSLAVDIPPWRPRLDAAAAGWADPGPGPGPSAEGTEAGGPDAQTQKRRRDRAGGGEAGGGVSAAGAAGGAAAGPPRLRLLACAPDLLPCLRELGLSVRELRGLRLVTPPSLASSGAGGGAGGSGGCYGGGSGFGGCGGCLGMAPGCSSVAAWEAAMPACGPSCACAAGCGLSGADGGPDRIRTAAGAAAMGMRTGDALTSTCSAVRRNGAGATGASADWHGKVGHGGGRGALEALARCAALAASSPPHPGADAVAALRLLPAHLIPLAVPLRAPSPPLQAEAAAAAAVEAVPAAAAAAGGPPGLAGGSAVADVATRSDGAAVRSRHLSYIEVGRGGVVGARGGGGAGAITLGTGVRWVRLLGRDDRCPDVEPLKSRRTRHTRRVNTSTRRLRTRTPHAMSARTDIRHERLLRHMVCRRIV